MSSHSPTIHLWTPGLLDFKGGIQTYSGLLLRGLRRVWPQAKICAFALHDQPRPKFMPDALPFGVDELHTTGQTPPQRRTVAFSTLTARMALTQRPDLIITTHVNFTPVALGLKQLAGIPYWGVAHGFEAWHVDKPMVRWGMAQADRILAVSGFTRDRIQRDQKLTNLAVLPNTLEGSRFQVQPKPPALLRRYGLDPRQPVVLTVNRLAAGESFHSYDQILAALPALRLGLPGLHYLIVGKGGDRPRLERLITQLGLNDCVTLAGFVADEELPDHYALCDLFAMPSVLEGFGIVYLEALACGKPVLAGLDGGQDALQQGKLGALVDAQDVPAITKTLEQLLNGTYPNPLVYQPHALRQHTLAAFGPTAFGRTLAEHLHTQFGERFSDQFATPFQDSRAPASTALVT